MNTTNNAKIRYYLGSKLPKYITQRAMVRFCKENNMFFYDRVYAYNTLSKTLSVTSEEFTREFLSL